MSVAERILGEPHTRAEAVRARRARHERPQQPALKQKRTRRRKARRRFDLTLPFTLGAEIRLPALPQLRPGPRLLSLGLLLLVAASVRGLLLAPQFYVEAAEVSGNELLTTSQIRSIAQADQAPIFLVDRAEALDRFAEVAEIAKAEVRFGWPNQVQIEVVERSPMVAWYDGYRDWWLSEDGVAFLKHGERSGLIEIRSQQPVLNIQEDPLAQVIDPQILIAAGVLSAQLPQVDEFEFDSAHGLGFVDEHGWTAYFGTDGDMVSKVRLYQALVDYLESSGRTASLVSVADPATPFTKQ